MIYPWLNSQWQLLLKQQQQKCLPHALLLEGPQGLGKLALAESLAELVLCEQSSDKACQYCRSCQLFAAANHPDYFKITPEEEGKAIKIEQIRELTAQLSQCSHGSGYQVAIIAPAHKMNRSAANALLKTLEEPSGKVLIILVSDQTSFLPATIISRCQRIPCGGHPLEAEAWLKAKISNPDELALLLEASDYAPLRALDLAQLNYPALRAQLIDQLIALKKNQIDLLKVALDWSKQDIPLLLSTLQMIMLELIRLNLNHTEHNSASLRELQGLATNSEWLKFLEKLQQTTALCQAANNINVQMALEALLVLA